MTKKPTLTGGGKSPPSDGGRGGSDRRPPDLTVVEGEGDLPAPLPPVDDPNRPAAIITPKGYVTSRVSYRPPEPTQETLMGADHAEWLKMFAQHMSLDTGVAMTPFRQGAITRLWWAFRFIEFLNKRNSSLQTQLAATERDLTRALAAVDVHSKSRRPASTDADNTPAPDGAEDHDPAPSDSTAPHHSRVPQSADPAGPRAAGGRPPGRSPPTAPDRAPDVPPQPGEDDPGKV
jgi:hypothetical protein